MTFWKWSKTAANNGTADDTCPFPEGMAPSAVNDGVRGAMAAAAKYRDDVAGTLATGGSSTAYTVSSNQSFDTLAHMDGAMIAFVPHATSGAAPTLAVDGLTAKKIRFATGTDIPDGVLIQGTPYVVTYYASVGEFILHNIAGNPYNIPLGGLLPYTWTTSPNSSLVFPYGQAISRATYATYFTLVGTTYGAGDGSTTFNLPDIRGRVIAGKDDMGGTSANRLTAADDGLNGDTLGATGGGETQTLVTANLPAYTPAGSVAIGGTATTTAGQAANTVNAGVGPDRGVNGTGTVSIASVTGSFTGTAQGGTSTAFGVVQPTIVFTYLLRVI